ncbi:hypothetical protein [Opitutus sp. ER46]|uniref:hypothetical protein n=1 Tax=Opitutus sp. ER46 TaxID=2161864 RepID=UPI000D2FBC6C|nr:hypothetical protein [Opitutus sp. ER46]PTX95767.1 hypothetical protein DB354_10170 [Opitutus sp. ER46]
MIKARTVIGAHGFFFPDGTAFTIPAAGTCGRQAKPGAADPKWFDLGISDYGFKPNNKVEEVKAAAPGARVLWDLITVEKGLTITAKIMELSNLVYQMLLGTNTLPDSPTAGGQYNPLEGDPVVRGWLQVQQYNQANVLINTLDVFVAMQIPGDVKFDDKLVDVDVEMKVLFSTLNTGTLS